MKTCADCGCDETRGCVDESHGRPFFCHLIDTSTPGLPPVLCSFCLSARGYIDLRGPTLREIVVGLNFEIHGRAGLEDMANKYGKPPEVMRALAAMDHPCSVCSGRDAECAT
jgi:hypothetical protein